MEKEGIYMYGSGECDQLGNIKDKEGENIMESRIPRYLPINSLSQIEKIYKICCGGMHTLLLTSQGNLYSWGCSDGGTLGREGTDNIPSKINLNIPIEDISAGDCHSIAYNKRLNKIYFWGTFRNSQGEMGNNINQPKEIGLNLINNEDIFKVLSGNNHVIILTEQGHIYAFGNGEFGQTGINPNKISNIKIENNEHLIPNKIKGENIINIFTGGNHSFLIEKDGKKKFKSWGCNTFGQLGINSFENKFEPEEVKFPEKNIEIITCTGGDFHTLALTNNNDIYSWGRNDESQCGLPINNIIGPDGNEMLSCISIPTKLNNIKKNDIKEVESYGNFNYVYNPENGKCYSWGFGSSYVLGNKKEENEIKPYEIKKEFFKNMRLRNLSLGQQHICCELEKPDKPYIKTTFEFDYPAHGYSIRKQNIRRKGDNSDRKERTNRKRRENKFSKESNIKTKKKKYKKKDDSDENYTESEEAESEEEEIEERKNKRNKRKKSVSKIRKNKKENEDDNIEEEEDEEEEEEEEEEEIITPVKKRKNNNKSSVSKYKRKNECKKSCDKKEKNKKKLSDKFDEEEESNTSETVGVVINVKLCKFNKKENDENEYEKTQRKRKRKINDNRSTKKNKNNTKSKSKSKSIDRKKKSEKKSEKKYEKKSERKTNKKNKNKSRSISKSKSKTKQGKKSVKK